MHSLGSNLTRLHQWRDWLGFRSLVLLAPFLMLTVKHWISAIVFVTAIAAIVWLVRHRATPYSLEAGGRRRWVAWAIAGPILAVGLAQCYRGEFFLGNFDPPLRMLLCVPIFWLFRGGGCTGGMQHQ